MTPGKQFSIKITNASPVVNSPTITDAHFDFRVRPGQPYGASFRVAGSSTVAVAVSGLPAGLSLVPVSSTNLAQQIAGIPTGTTGVYPVTISATDTIGRRTTLTVGLVVYANSDPSAALALITPGQLGTVPLGGTFSFRLVAMGGSGNYAFHADEAVSGTPATLLTTDGRVEGTMPTGSPYYPGDVLSVPMQVSDGVTTIHGYIYLTIA
jgi:hypothetical protein